MYTLDYMPNAIAEILAIEADLYAKNPVSAGKFSEAIIKQGESLISNPFMWPIYRRNKRFRLMILPYQYLCFYHIDERTKVITVHHVRNSKQKKPRLRQPKPVR